MKNAESWFTLDGSKFVIQHQTQKTMDQYPKTTNRTKSKPNQNNQTKPRTKNTIHSSAVKIMFPIAKLTETPQNFSDSHSNPNVGNKLWYLKRV